MVGGWINDNLIDATSILSLFPDCLVPTATAPPVAGEPKAARHMHKRPGAAGILRVRPLRGRPPAGRRRADPKIQKDH